MPLNLRQVHEFAKVPGTQTFRLVRTNPVMRLACSDGVVLIQKGTVYTEGGIALKQKDLPAWFADEMSKCSPAALAECGWKAPVAPVKGD